MSAWKRGRCQVDRRGWGTAPEARRVGRNRRDLARREHAERLDEGQDLRWARGLLEDAWRAYESAALRSPDFESIRARYYQALARVEGLAAQERYRQVVYLPDPTSVPIYQQAV